MFLKKHELVYLKFKFPKGKFIHKIKNWFKIKNWNWFYISKNTPIEFIECNLHIPWNWDGVSLNESINLDFVKKSPFLSLKLVCKHKGISLKDIENNPNLFFYWDAISENPNLTIDFILKNINKKWDWYNLSKNSSITEKDIESNLHLPWNRKGLLDRYSLIDKNTYNDKFFINNQKDSNKNWFEDNTCFKKDMISEICKKRKAFLKNVDLPNDIKKVIIKHIGFR